MKGDNNARMGTGMGESEADTAFSNSSRYISARWKVRLAGTRTSVGLEEGISRSRRGHRKEDLPERATCMCKYGNILLKRGGVPFSSYEEPEGGIEKTSDEHVVLVHPWRRLSGEQDRERVPYIP